MTKARKRFYDQAAVIRAGDGYQVTLDGRPIHTPAKSLLILPNVALADWIVQEWADQKEQINPQTMPATRMANSAIDKVIPNVDAIRDLMADYGCSDLLCYRVEQPTELKMRQSTAWDPLLAWAGEKFGLEFNSTTGVMPISQPDGHRTKLINILEKLTHFELAAFHDLVTISGSFVLGLAIATNRMPVTLAWDTARIDEIWQIEQWGSDSESEQSAYKKRIEIEHAKRFFDLCRVESILC